MYPKSIASFPLQFLIDKISELEQTRGKFRLCPQCLIVSGVLRKVSPNLMPRQKQNGRHREGLLQVGKRHFCLRKTGHFKSVDGGFVRGQQNSGDKIKEWPII